MATVHSFKPDIIFSDEPFENSLLLIYQFEKHLETFLKISNEISYPREVIFQLKQMTDFVYHCAIKLKKAYIKSQYSPSSEYVCNINETIQKLNQIKTHALFYKSHFLNSTQSLYRNFEKTNFSKVKSSFIMFKNAIKSIIDNDKNDLSYAASMWPKNDVLVGSLRNSKQLNVALKHNFYHIPESLVENPEDIKCIAVYQSKNLFGIDSGIKYYGKVVGFKKVERYKIKEIPSESDEIYVKFEIDSWKMMKRTIVADYLGDTCLFTSLFQLMQCEKTSELLLSGKLEFDLYMFMKANVFTQNCACLRFIDSDIIYKDDFFEIYQNQKCVLKISSERFFKNGVSSVKIISALQNKSNLD